MVGTPRRRGPKFQARMRRFWMRRRRCRKNRTAAARHPYLGGNERAAARELVRQHLVKKMVGTPRRRGPKSQARERRFWIQRRRCRKNRTAAARHPYLGGNERAAARKREERSIKAKPRPKFAPRRVGAKVSTGKVLTEVEVLS